MNKSIVIASVLLLTSTLANADEVMTVERDRVLGGGFGGLSGFMLGAAAGGPLGALVGAGVGYFAGQGVQEVAGPDHSLYVLRDEEGNITRLRTSAKGFEVGQQVERGGSQLAARP